MKELMLQIFKKTPEELENQSRQFRKLDSNDA